MSEDELKSEGFLRFLKRIVLSRSTPTLRKRRRKVFPGIALNTCTAIGRKGETHRRLIQRKPWIIPIVFNTTQLFSCNLTWLFLWDQPPISQSVNERKRRSRFKILNNVDEAVTTDHMDAAGRTGSLRCVPIFIDKQESLPTRSHRWYKARVPEIKSGFDRITGFSALGQTNT